MADDGMELGTLDHLLRAAPPWHTGPRMTECGRAEGDVQSIVDRPTMQARVNKLGKQRAAMVMCMSCVNLYSRPFTWARHPAEILRRFIESQQYRVRRGDDTRSLLMRELLALGMLVEDHREEFEGYVAALEQTADLDQARRRSRMRAVRGG